MKYTKTLARIMVFSSIILLLSLSVLAETIKVDKYVIGYDKAYEADTDADGFDDRYSYYLDGILVLSTYDTDKDGKADMWFRYSDGSHKDLAMRDTSGNGKPDDIVGYDTDGKITFEESKGFDLMKYFPYLGAILAIGLIIVILMLIKKQKIDLPKKAIEHRKEHIKEKTHKPEKIPKNKIQGDKPKKPKFIWFIFVLLILIFVVQSTNFKYKGYLLIILLVCMMVIILVFNRKAKQKYDIDGKK